MCVPVLINGPKGIIKANGILVPLLVVGIIISSVSVLKSTSLSLPDLMLNNVSAGFNKRC